MPCTGYHLGVNARVYCKLLLILLVGFVAIHICFNLYNYQVAETEWLIHQLFELDEENNLPTWFSSFLLLNNAFFLYLIAREKKDKFRFHWLILAFGFLVLSIDEVAGVHESFNTAVDINWAIPAGIVVMLVGLAYIPFLLSLPRRLAILFIVSGVLFVGGAIGVELLSEDMDDEAMPYGFATALEEGMEMLGAWLFLFVIINDMKQEQRIDIGVSIG